MAWELRVVRNEGERKRRLNLSITSFETEEREVRVKKEAFINKVLLHLY